MQRVSAVAGLQRTLVMGVLNATPDSFFPDSRIVDGDDLCRLAEQAVSDGADILDIGGESSRPGSEPVGLDEELRRVVPVLEAAVTTGCAVSIDTYRAETARRACALGASMINDITGLRGDPEMAGVIAETGAECVIMHMQGTPATMQDAPHYDDVVDDLCAFFEERIRYTIACGVSENRIWLDPGFGFGKSVDDNLTLLRRLSEFGRLGRPLMVGTSNKSTIGAVLNADVNERGEGTAATVALAIQGGAAAVRVHDVKAMTRVARMSDAILGRIPID